MRKLKKVAAVAAMVGGLGLIGTGMASASDGDDAPPPPRQAVDCEQSFDAGEAHNHFGPGTGDETVNEGNFCAAIGSIDG